MIPDSDSTIIPTTASSKTLLIVEDEESLLTALNHRFTAAGYTVLCEQNGEDGLHTALQQRPNIILTDLLMPKMDGIGMLDALRQDVWGAHVPVIILTNSDTTDELLQKINTDHPSYYLLKTECSLDDIAEKVNEVLSSTFEKSPE